MHNDQEKVIDDMKKIREKNTLIPFVGAGFSVNVGYPLWDAFILSLQKELNKKVSSKMHPISLKQMFNDDSAESTQFFYWYMGHLEYKDDSNTTTATMLKKGKELFRDYVFKKFDEPDYNSDDYQQHESLIEKFKYIYTTNWDKLLEETCDSISKEYGYEKRYSPLNTHPGYGGKYDLKKYYGPIGDSNRRVITKFHGCKDDRDGTSIVASSADYFDRISESNQHPLDQQLLRDIKDNSFLFIGYSLTDINLKYLLNQIYFRRWKANSKQRSDTKFYFITLDDPRELSMYKMNYLRNCNDIVPIFLCDEDHLLHRVKGKSQKAINEKNKIRKEEICNFLDGL